MDDERDLDEERRQFLAEALPMFAKGFQLYIENSQLEGDAKTLDKIEADRQRFWDRAYIEALRIAEPPEKGDEPRAYELLEAAAHMADRAVLHRVASAAKRRDPSKFPIDFEAVKHEMRKRGGFSAGATPYTDRKPPPDDEPPAH